MAIDLDCYDRSALERRLLRDLPWRPVDACWLVKDLWLDKDGYPILCVGPRRLRSNRVAHHVWNASAP